MMKFIILVAFLIVFSNTAFARDAITGSMLCEVAYNKVVSVDSGCPAELGNSEGALGSSRTLEFSYGYLKPTKFLALALKDGEYVLHGFYIKSILVEPGQIDGSVIIKRNNEFGLMGEVSLFSTQIALRQFLGGFFSDYLLLTWDQENK